MRGHLKWSTPLRSSRGFEGAFLEKGYGGNIVVLVPELDAVLVAQTENCNRQSAQMQFFVVPATLLRTLSLPEEQIAAQGRTIGLLEGHYLFAAIVSPKELHQLHQQLTTSC